MEFRNTLKAASAIGVSHSRLSRAVWEGRIKPPQKGPGGNYLWAEKDLERASWALRHRSYCQNNCVPME